MKDRLIDDCTTKARSEFRRSLIVTSILVILSLIVTLDWISRFDGYVNIVHFSYWLFSVEVFAVFVLWMLTAARLLSAGTFNRFVDSLAKKHPESLYVVVHRERAAFDQRVKDVLRIRG